MAMFLELPENWKAQEFKANVYQLLCDAGVAIPLPTSHPPLNWGTARPALVELGIVHLFGQIWLQMLIGRIPGQLC